MQPTEPPNTCLDTSDDLSSTVAGEDSINEKISIIEYEDENDVVIVKPLKPVSQVQLNGERMFLQLRHDLEDRMAAHRMAFQHQNHSLRINVSDLAACAGFHPFKCLPKVLQEHIYQGSAGQALLRHDAQLLGLQIVSDQEVWHELAKKAGESTQAAFKKALQVKTGETKLKSVEAAEELRAKVFQEAKSSQRLTAKQLAVLEDGARHSINTGFGTTWEDQALDLYERQCGWDVTERNAEVRVWDFDANGVELAPAYAAEWQTKHKRNATSAKQLSSLSSLEEGNKRQKVEPMDVDIILHETDIGQSVKTESWACKEGSTHEQNIPTSLMEKKNDIAAQLPFFCLRGSVDGIRDELAPVVKQDGNKAEESKKSNVDEDNYFSDEDESWALRRVVVECKHRMRRLQPTPPLYEMIQATVYCMMYETQVADLVQILRKQRLPQRPTTKLQDEGKENETVNSITNYFSKNSKNTTKSDADESIKESSIPATTTTSRPKNDENSSTHDTSKDVDEGKLLAITESKLGGKIANVAGVEPEASSTMETVRKGERDAGADLEIAVSRISIDDPVFQHRQNWTGTVLPRIQSWTQAVYSIRKEDSKRYQLLMALAAEDLSSAWTLLLQACPWLQHCDTSYRRDTASDATK